MVTLATPRVRVLAPRPHILFQREPPRPRVVGWIRRLKRRLAHSRCSRDTDDIHGVFLKGIFANVLCVHALDLRLRTLNRRSVSRHDLSPQYHSSRLCLPGREVETRPGSQSRLPVPGWSPECWLLRPIQLCARAHPGRSRGWLSDRASATPGGTQGEFWAHGFPLGQPQLLQTVGE